MIAHRRSCARATAALLALVAVFSILIPPAFALPRSDLLVQTASSQFRFEVEVADDPTERAEGLMYRETMADNAGMLFLYPAPQNVQFWMKNTPMSLDIVFIRADGSIANIAENTVPFSEDKVASEGPVAAVLEIRGGRAAELGIDAGDRVSWPGQRAVP